MLSPLSCLRRRNHPWCHPRCGSSRTCRSARSTSISDARSSTSSPTWIAVEPEFVPAALAFGSGIHGAAAFLLRGVQEGKAPSLADVQAFFEAYWQLETGNRPIRFGEKDTKESLLDLGAPDARGFHAKREPGAEVLARRAAVRRAADRPRHRRDPRPRAGRHARPGRARRRGPRRGRGSQDVSAEVHEPPGRGVAPTVGLQLRHVDERPRPTRRTSGSASTC